ncbi:unnamed protein product, partial [Prorocentrum cordatum]
GEALAVPDDMGMCPPMLTDRFCRFSGDRYPTSNGICSWVREQMVKVRAAGEEPPDFVRHVDDRCVLAPPIGIGRRLRRGAPPALSCVRAAPLRQHRLPGAARLLLEERAGLRRVGTRYHGLFLARKKLAGSGFFARANWRFSPPPQVDHLTAEGWAEFARDRTFCVCET